METTQSDELPTGNEWQYEPNWDGMRCIVFRDGDDIQLQSKSGESIGHDFPDVIGHMRAIGAEKFVLDGEIVIPHEANPARFVVFDLLLTERGKLLTNRRLVERRQRLEAFAERYFDDAASVRLSQVTGDIDVARGWLKNGNVGLDGVIARNTELPYKRSARNAMVTVKPR